MARHKGRGAHVDPEMQAAVREYMVAHTMCQFRRLGLPTPVSALEAPDQSRASPTRIESKAERKMKMMEGYSTVSNICIKYSIFWL